MRSKRRTDTAKTPKKSRSSRRNQSPGLVRIIGGDWRGRKLPVLNQAGLRPTSDRIRETLFNWLQFEIAGKHCLDAFSGSGILGLETLSRGASTVTFLEKNASATQQLQKNITLLKSNKAQVIQTDSLKWLQQTPIQKFDLVFIDPPFEQGLVEQTLQLLFAQDWLNHQAWLYIEQEKKLDWPIMPAGWEIYREKTTAYVRLGLWHQPEYDDTPF